MDIFVFNVLGEGNLCIKLLFWKYVRNEKVGKLHSRGSGGLKNTTWLTVGINLYWPLLNLYLTMLVISTEAAYCTALCWTVGHSKSGRAL